MAGMLARSRTVDAPDGRVWKVRRQLVPRPPRWKGRWLGGSREKRSESTGAGDWLHALDGVSGLGDVGGLGGVGAAIAAFALVAFLLVFAWFVLFPVLFFLADLLIVLLIAAGGIALRVPFRRPWKIEARPEDVFPGGHSWGVVGLRASAETIDTVADAIAGGIPPEKIQLPPR